VPDRTSVVDKAEELVLGLWRETDYDRSLDPMRSEACVVHLAKVTGTVPTAVFEAVTVVLASTNTPQSPMPADRPAVCVDTPVDTVAPLLPVTETDCVGWAASATPAEETFVDPGLAFVLSARKLKSPSPHH